MNNVTETLEGELGFKGERGYSAYEIAVKHGYTGTEEQWSQDFTNPDNFYDKMEMDLKLEDYIPKDDIVDNTTSTDTDKPLSANQGKELKTLVDSKADSTSVYSKTDVDTLLSSKADTTDVYDKTEIDSALNNCVIKNDFAIIETTKKTWEEQESATLSYPTGFSYDNCIVLSVNSFTGLYGLGGTLEPYINARGSDSNQYLTGSYASVRTDQSNIQLITSAKTFNTKFIIVLMKLW